MAILFVVVLHRARFGVELRMLRVIDISFTSKKIEINKELRVDYTKLNRATSPGQFLEAEERKLSLNLLARYVHGWE